MRGAVRSLQHPGGGSAERIARLLFGCVAVAAASGAVVGWLLPRGPVTTWQALAAIAGTLLVGVAAGRWSTSRWAMLAAPIAFAVAFEIARARVDGPTVDGVRLDGVYGVMALLVGRGVDAVLMLFPMVVGAAYGAAFARRSTGLRRPSWLRRGVLGVATLLVVLLVAGLLRPASTEPIVGDDGRPVPESVAELVELNVDGSEQWLMLRGNDVNAPVVLFLEGGPGGTGIGRIRKSGTALEQNFVVATWDQRGTGKSYAGLEPASTLTVDRMVQDALAVTDYLRERFDEQKIYLVGSSWGTLLGVLAVQRSPERFHAYVGTGQMVDPFETDILMYEESLDDAQLHGDEAGVQALQELGPPPYDDTLDYPLAVASNPRWTSFRRGEDYNPASEYPASLFVPEYTLIEQLRGMAAIAETFSVLYPQLAEVDFRMDVPRLEVPVYIVDGRFEADGRKGPLYEWYDLLHAPSKELVVFDYSGHTPPYDEPGHFASFMAHVHAATAAR